MKKLLNLENFIYLIIFFLPAYLLRAVVLGLPTNVLEILIFILFISWIVWGKLNQERIIPFAKYVFPIALIFLGLSLSTLINRNSSVGFGIMKGWFFFPLILFFLTSQIIEKKKIINIFKAYYLSSFFVAVIAFVYLIFGKLTYDSRLEAFFNSPNYLAMYLAPALIILAQVSISKFKVKRYGLEIRVFSLISGLILSVAFYFTYSYAAWISVILSLIAVSIVRNRKIFRNKTIFFLVLLIFIIVFSQLSNEKLINIKNFNRSSLESRIMIWNSAERILRDNWLVGIGPGNFQNTYLEYQRYYPPYLEWAVPHPHNLYLSFWLYGGILGIAGFLWAVASWANDIIKKDDNTLKFIVLGIMFYILMHGLFDTTYFKNDLAVVFWLNYIALML
jgi:O-antigen ligase